MRFIPLMTQFYSDYTLEIKKKSSGGRLYCNVHTDDGIGYLFSYDQKWFLNYTTQCNHHNQGLCDKITL